MKKYIGKMTVEAGGIESEVVFLLVVKKSLKSAIKKFERQFYGSTFNRTEDMYIVDDDFGADARHTGVDCQELTEAEFEVMAKYLPVHEI